MSKMHLRPSIPKVRRGNEMTYNEIIKNMERFGASADEICKNTLGVSIESMHPDVILSPGWPPERLFRREEITLLTEASPLFGFRIWRVQRNGRSVTYVNTGYGAPMAMEAMLLLGMAGIRRVLFVSSVGALSEKILVGDILLPRTSTDGCGTGRYLTDDPWSVITNGEQAPDETLFARLTAATDKLARENGVIWHYGKTLCVDTIVSQYGHIDEIVRRGYDSLDMESAVVFQTACMMGVSAAALLHVSDNSVMNQSLMSSRASHGGREYRSFVRKEILPRIVHALFFE